MERSIVGIPTALVFLVLNIIEVGEGATIAIAYISILIARYKNDEYVERVVLERI
jgi:hypothetical protein